MYLKIINEIVMLFDIGFVPYEDATVNIDYPGDVIIYYKINNLPRAKAKNKLLMIPKVILQKDILFFEITVEDPAKKTVVTYKSDQISLRKAVIIGDSEDQVYPSTLAKLFRELSELRKTVITQGNILDKHEKRIYLLETEGDFI